MGATLSHGKVAQLSQKFIIVGFIITMSPSETRAVDAWSAIERINTDARVISERHGVKPPTRCF